MAEKTDIQWCDSTCNPTTGCDGCELWVKGRGGPCYAGNHHETRMVKLLPQLYAPDFTEVRLAPGRMAKAAAWSDLTGEERPEKPWLNGMPRVIFVGDMGDLFSADVPLPYIADEVIGAATSAKGRRHIWMLLTKQPKRMRSLVRELGYRGVKWPANVWAGVSVTSAANLSRLTDLAHVPAAVRFASYEPAVAEVDLRPWLDDSMECEYCGPMTDPQWEPSGPNCVEPVCPRCFTSFEDNCSTVCACEPHLDLVILGGESNQGPHRARPFDLGWAERVIAACRARGAAVFIKQLGSNPTPRRIPRPDAGSGAYTLEPLRIRDSHGGDWSEWPSDLRIREFPAPSLPSPVTEVPRESE